MMTYDRQLRGPGVTVVVVDDEPDIRTIVGHALRGTDQWTVVELGPAAALVDQIADAAPDVVLLDVMMPGTDGRQVLGAIRRHPRIGSVEVIFVTAQASEGETCSLQSLDVAGVITKPFDPLGLADLIRQIVGGALGSDQTMSAQR